LLAYLVNGLTLGRAYFDFLYQVVALIIVVRILARRDLEVARLEAEPVEELEPVAA